MNEPLSYFVENHDEKVLDIIEKGGGTKDFLPLGKKGYLPYKND